MVMEKSCGAVVFTKENGQTKYVIIQSKAGFYGFPKGHMKGTETEKETALREVREETGLTVDLIDTFRTEDLYPINCSGKQRMKHVVYFLAKYTNQIPVVQELELNSISLMDFEEALSVLQFDSAKRVLTQAQEFLSKSL